MNKILTYTVITTAILGLCGAAVINAQAEGDNGTYPAIVQKLAERFNLNLDDVQQVFKDAGQERQQGMQARFEKKLGAGLTDEQKQAISAKQEEIRQKFEALKDLSLEERQAKMQDLREEMKAWAEQNGIDSKFIWGFGRGCNRGLFNPGQ